MFAANHDNHHQNYFNSHPPADGAHHKLVGASQSDGAGSDIIRGQMTSHATASPVSPSLSSSPSSSHDNLHLFPQASNVDGNDPHNHHHKIIDKVTNTIKNSIYPLSSTQATSQRSKTLSSTRTTLSADSGNIVNKITNNSTSDDDQWSILPNMENVSHVFSFGCSVAIMFGGLVPYIPQYIKIKRLRNCEGFSTYVCLTLLIANILRIAFWFGHRFETPLLIQSFVMVAGMLAMMEICVRVRADRLGGSNSSFVIATSVTGDERRGVGQSAAGCSEDREDPDDDPGVGHAIPRPGSPGPSGASRSRRSGRRSVMGRIFGSRGEDDLNANLNSEESRPIYSVGLDQEANAMERTTEAVVEFHKSNNQSNGPTTGPVSNWILPKRILGLNLRKFWNWNDFFSYIQFLAIFTIIISLLTYLLLDCHMFVESMGFVSTLTESMLGMPQVARNFSKKSTRGMSVVMVAMWLSGDLFKTLYFIIRNTPSQFYICGSIQVIVDLIILGQVFWYRRSNLTYWKMPESG